MDVSCASQAATAICSMDEGSSSSSSTIHLGRATNGYNPIIRDSTRVPKSLPTTPCWSRWINSSTQSSTSTSSDDDIDMQKRKSSITSINSNKLQSRKLGGWGCKNPGDFISPPGCSNSRYLLSNISKSFSLLMKKEESSVSLPIPPPSCSPHQVVVLRVSLHCKGCEKKLRKHISRMQGVTSFDIDLDAKTLTVVGDLTPLSVLSSVSKVKNAQLLAPTISSSTPTSASSDRSRIQKSNTVM